MQEKAAELTLVIPVMGSDPELSGTIANARETAAIDIEIIVVIDGADPKKVNVDAIDADQVVILRKRQGSSAARHAGVVKAASPYVATCDAHMRFEDGWGEVLCDELETDPGGNVVFCGHMGTLGENMEPTSNANHTGARIAWRTVEPADVFKGPEAGKVYQSFHAKWFDEPNSGEIGCVMGAMYAFRLAWYISMGQPWKVGKGYGCDEELISLGSWLCGGSVQMSSVQVWHKFSTTGHNVDIGMWVTRARLLYLAPLTDDERTELLQWLRINPALALGDAFNVALASDLSRPEVGKLQKRWASRERWEKYATRFITHYGGSDSSSETLATFQEHRSGTTTTEAPPVLTATSTTTTVAPGSQVFFREVETCERCLSMDSFRVTSSRASIGRGPKRQYLKCRVCGASAVRLSPGGLNFSVSAANE